MTEKSLLEFPCDFIIKIMGMAGEDFNTCVIEILQRHAPDLDQSSIGLRYSRGGKYVSLTAVIPAKNREQLDAIYRELSGNERVLMAL